ncbi:PREDICTED: metaxin-2 [Drosophila arizonae]|uniref:Metaxin-2 n=1 Tax=Drosophila arizonae TaxID=7263 RepID=A0ABM1PRY1_DROAR|nr:PREDICTED: metaxin-2 [Drosophila arizonae]
METEMEVASAMLQASDTQPAVLPGESLPWPKDVCLYQPLEETQLLLPEQASCLAVKTYLRMCRLPYTERQCDNAEFMSTGGRLTKLPLMRLGRRLFAEFEPIVVHVECTQLANAVSSWMGFEEREDMRSEVTYVENTFTLAELHQCFKEASIYADHTQPRIGSAHPWPLSSIRRREKSEEALRLLRVYQWDELSTRGVQVQLQQCCQLLSDKLEAHESNGKLSANYLYGQQLCELDALVFGHVASILNSQLACPMLSDTVRAYPRLVAHSRGIDQVYHQGKQLGGQE